MRFGTPHLTGKKLPTNSPWDFEYVFETMDDYWVGPDKNFCPESTRTRWRCNHFSKKWSKSKSDTTLSIKKPFVTPNFCGQNLSTMHHFRVWIFLSSKITPHLVWKTENAPKWVLGKKWLKIKPKVIHRLVLGSFWHQRRSWFIIAQTCPNSSDLE